MKDYLEGRIVRLETCLLGLAALISGEAVRVAKSPDELAEFQNDIARQMEAMQKDIPK